MATCLPTMSVASAGPSVVTRPLLVQAVRAPPAVVPRARDEPGVVEHRRDLVLPHLLCLAELSELEAAGGPAQHPVRVGEGDLPLGLVRVACAQAGHGVEVDLLVVLNELRV